jgi:hypothetical protein
LRSGVVGNWVPVSGYSSLSFGAFGCSLGQTEMVLIAIFASFFEV